MCRFRATTLGFALALLVSGCGDGDRPPAGDHADLDGTNEAPALDAARPEAPERRPVEVVSAAPVTLWKGPGGQPFEVALRTADPASAHARAFGTITMQTSLRTRAPGVGQYPCTSCHLGRALTLEKERVADAHQNIASAHPTQTGALCSTCHAPDNVELLSLQSGERATLDHVYRLCAQCHFAQTDAWAAGAHGKRLDGWQGRRVLMGCADCHDPHDPRLEKRIPFRAPQLTRTRGDQ